MGQLMCDDDDGAEEEEEDDEDDDGVPEMPVQATRTGGRLLINLFVCSEAGDMVPEGSDTLSVAAWTTEGLTSTCVQRLGLVQGLH